MLFQGNRTTNQSKGCERAFTLIHRSAGTRACMHTHTLGLCVDLRVNEWMIEGCRGWGEQCRGNNPLSQEGSIEHELETKKGIENECLRDKMKFRLCVQRPERAVGWTSWSRSFLSANKASSMYLTRTQRERKSERSSCWRRRVRQRRSGGLSLLALQCEDCYVGGGRERESRRKKGEQERKKRASKEYV